MTNILLVTVECVRDDHRQHCPVFDDLDTVRGVAPGSFTRPSLAGLHSGQFTAALDAAVQGPALAERLQRAGYDTAAVTYSPQTAPVFGFDRGFDTYESVDGDDGPLACRWRRYRGMSWSASMCHHRTRGWAGGVPSAPRRGTRRRPSAFRVARRASGWRA